MTTEKEEEDSPILPMELFLPIMEVLAADGAYRTLSNCLQTSHGLYELGIPILLRKIMLTTYRHDLAAAQILMNDPSKFRHVRSLRIHSPRGHSFFQHAAPYVTEAEVELSDAEFGKKLFLTIAGASNLTKLKLAFWPQDMVFFVGLNLLPHKIERVDASFYCPTNALGFTDSLAGRSDVLKEWTLRTSVLPHLSLGKEPDLLRKLTSLEIPFKHLQLAATFAPTTAVEELKVLMTHVILRSDSDLFPDISQFTTLETLILSNFKTKDLAGVHFLTRPLKLLKIIALWPSSVSDGFEKAKKAVEASVNLVKVEMMGRWAADPLGEREKWPSCAKVSVFDDYGRLVPTSSE